MKELFLAGEAHGGNQASRSPRSSDKLHWGTVARDLSTSDIGLGLKMSSRKSLPWIAHGTKLAKSDNRSSLAPTRTDSGPPESWFPNSALSEKGLYSVSFDYFVNWQSGKVENMALFKLSLTHNEAGVVGAGLASIRQSLAEYAPQGARAVKFCGANRMEPYWVLIPDWYAWDDGRDSMLLCPMDELGLPKSVERYSFHEIQSFVEAHTGERFTLQKGLRYSTTGLEASLSRTATPWPGDVDLIIASERDDRPLVILEFRKQTQQGVPESKFPQYYPGVDERRWNRIAMLSHSYGNIPVVALNYSTLTEQTGIHLCRISGSPGKLVQGTTMWTSIPLDEEDCKNLVDSILQL